MIVDTSEETAILKYIEANPDKGLNEIHRALNRPGAIGISKGTLTKYLGRLKSQGSVSISFVKGRGGESTRYRADSKIIEAFRRDWLADLDNLELMVDFLALLLKTDKSREKKLTDALIVMSRRTSRLFLSVLFLEDSKGLPVRPEVELPKHELESEILQKAYYRFINILRPTYGEFARALDQADQVLEVASYLSRKSATSVLQRLRKQYAETITQTRKAEESREHESHAALLDKPISELRTAFEKIVETKLPLPG
jgi:hypothetical protein